LSRFVFRVVSPIYLLGRMVLFESWTEFVLFLLVLLLLFIHLKRWFKPSKGEKESDETENKLDVEQDRLLKKYGFDPDKLELFRSTCRNYAMLKLLDEINERLIKIEQKLGKL